MRARLAFAFLATLALGALARGDDPKIVGPTAVDPYKVVRLSATGLDPKAGILWRVTPQPGAGKPDFAQGGKRNLPDLEFVGAPGAYDVTLVYVIGDATGKYTINELTWAVTIGTPTPPVPPPAPGPQPAPPNPQPVPAPVGTGAWVVVIVDEANPTAAQEMVATGDTLTALKTAGKCRVYGSVSDSDKITAKGYDRMVTDAKLKVPAFFVLDKSGKVVFAQALPTTDAAVAAALKGVMAP